MRRIPRLSTITERLALPTSATRLIELLLFAWLLPLAGWLAFADDPVGLETGFPWVISGALVFAARYGSVWGAACAVLTGLFINLPLAAYAGSAGQHLTLALGSVVMSLVVGDTASAWRTRTQRSEAENHYLRHRLKEFSTDYHVLKVSHGQLEEHMAGQRLSLREALQRLKPLLAGRADGLQAGSELMAVFSQFCSIQVAGLYEMSTDGQLRSRPVAIQGDMPELPRFDALLRTALKTRELVSIKLESLAEDHHEQSLLAVVPLVDTHGELHGVLAIKDMHFMAFQQQNLNILALLGNYVGNLLARSSVSAESKADWFLGELDTVLRFARSHNTASMLLSLKFDADTLAADVAGFVSHSIRGLDAAWTLPLSDGSTSLCLLLPLMSEQQSHAFLERIDRAVHERFGRSLDSVLQDRQSLLIDRQHSRALCLAFLSQHIEPGVLDAALSGTPAEKRSDVA